MFLGGDPEVCSQRTIHTQSEVYSQRTTQTQSEACTQRTTQTQSESTSQRTSITNPEVLSQRTATTHRNSCLSAGETNTPSKRDFKLFVDSKLCGRHFVHLIAPTVQEKEAWMSDISQCMDNIHLHSMLSPGLGGSSGGLYFHSMI